MGTNIKGKDLGRGISQRPDGTYRARYVDRTGSRIEKRFKNAHEAKAWLEERRYEDSHGGVIPDMTVDQWYHKWITEICRGLAPNTIRNYRDRYTINCRPIIGHMQLRAVKPIHCRRVFNVMDEAGYAGSTVRQTYICLGAMLKSAKENGLITVHPMDGVRYTTPVKPSSDIRYLTVQEQDKFLEKVRGTSNGAVYELILETGLRTSEVIGLTWDAVDLDKGSLTVKRSLEYRHKDGIWRAGPPKTKSSYRVLPLTDRAKEILREALGKKATRKQSGALEVLPYIDKITGQTMFLDMHECVFLCSRTGMPTKNSSYDTHLYKICDELGIQHISMHDLRHTYATRANEKGVPAKTLQRLLGHKSITVTMDTYVHVSDESLREAVEIFQGHKSSSTEQPLTDPQETVPEPPKPTRRRIDLGPVIRRENRVDKSKIDVENFRNGDKMGTSTKKNQ